METEDGITPEVVEKDDVTEITGRQSVTQPFTSCCEAKTNDLEAGWSGGSSIPSVLVGNVESPAPQNRMSQNLHFNEFPQEVRRRRVGSFTLEVPVWMQKLCPSSSPSSSSNSPCSSAVASWYCWYSDTRSFMLLSASVNSISSMPSPVYQWRKALRRNMAVNCSEMRLNSSWMAVLLPMKVADILRPRGGMSHTAVLTLLGIHSTK
ncbi:hypothetical protein GH733_016655 [Mirounga leonina]|nr:hypothetical protein GH733_016655 [Mirounga leonina]